MTLAGNISRNYREEHNLSMRALAECLTEVLSQREYSPRAITHVVIWQWEAGTASPNPLMMEWIRDHTDNPDLSKFASDLLAASNSPKVVA